MANICVIDDEAVVRESVAETLERAGHSVTAFGDAERAMGVIRSGAYDVVVTDLKMPRLDGASLLGSLRASRCEVPVIVMTAYGTVANAVEAMRLGAIDFIQKPFDADGLLMQVDRAIQHARLCAENEVLRTSLAEARRQRRMVGESAAMREVRTKIAQYAASDACVLISGESGTGKELAAAAIHESSPRREKLMLCLNCAALSANLLESELFGHERGAFTGADRQRKGRFELAHGGTLLLDEVSEMALPLQAKLLRVLQEGEFERVGSSTTLRSDARIVATTNRDLEEWVGRKRFREDLYYRLNVLPLKVPALRERREDIAAMVTHFVERFSRAAGRSAPRVERGAMEAFEEYGWPGNIRELENLCQRTVATTTGETIRAVDVESWLGRGGASSGRMERLRPGRMLEDMERQLIERTLRAHGGHRARSARALGMGIRTLGLKLKQWRDEEVRQGSRSVELEEVR